MDIKDKVVIVTGGANGIGKATAIELCNYMGKVIIADIDEENCQNLTKELKNKVDYIYTDISKEQDIKDLRDFIMEKYGRIDVLINNAAKQTENDFFSMTPSEFKSVIDVNLIGSFMCSNILGKEMKSGSKIINMLSVHYNLPRKNKYHYDASKAGIAILTKEMALELAEKGINVNGISYGACNTSMNVSWLDNEEKVKETLKKIPLKWIAEPEEIARFVRIVLENFSDYTTGSIFTIDGGRSLY